jgi:hypothetical protein
MAITAIVPLHFGLVVRCAYCSPMQPGTNKWVYLVHLSATDEPSFVFAIETTHRLANLAHPL